MLLGVMMALPALARDFTYTYEGQTLTYTVIDEDAKTCMTKAGKDKSTPGNDVSGSLIIPPTANDGTTDYAVTEIGDYAFSGCCDLKRVSISNSVTFISWFAFYGCQGLKELVIPNSVTTISWDAFNGCKGLEELTIPNSVNFIYGSAFEGCIGLTKVTISGVNPPEVWADSFDDETYLNAVLYAPECTFVDLGCSNWGGFKKIKIGGFDASRVFSYGGLSYRLFENPENPEAILISGNYSSLSKVTIPDGFSDDSNPVAVRYRIVGIGNNAFYECSNLRQVDFNSGSVITVIGVSAFDGCSGLTSIVIPNSVTSISQFAFNYCTSLTSLTLGNSVITIGGDSFYKCNSLTSLNIPESVTTIGAYAFGKCSSLTSLVIPNSVTLIGGYAFSKCSGLTSVAFSDGVEVLNWTSDVFDNLDSIKDLYIGRTITYVPLISPAPIANPESLTIGNTVTSIPASFCLGATKLKKLTLGSSLVDIGDNAFSGCTALTEVVMPPSIETIGESAFAGNTSLASIVMGHKVKSIGDKAFDGCQAKSVFITAQTPPAASNDAFSDYSGTLYLQGKAACDAYSEVYTCWNRFDSNVMIEPTEMRLDGGKSISGKAGDTFQLKATLLPENVTLPQVFWRSTNPKIATVDANGLVTLHADMSEAMAVAESDDETGACKIIAESLYANGPQVEVTVFNSDFNGIEDVVTDSPMANESIDFNAPYEVYNLNGIKVGDSTSSLPAGIYIVRQGNAVKKIAVN